MPANFLADNKTVQSIRARISAHARQHEFDNCMQEIVEPDAHPSPSHVADLYALWGDPLTLSDENYLRSCLAEVGAASGPIWMSGASLLTLIAGALCGKADVRSKQLWCLEADQHWANMVRSRLTDYRISNTHVIHSPARLFDGYVWYGVDTMRLAKAYQLIICDGDRSSPTGLIGALRRLGNRLDDQFTVLARNVRDPLALRAANDWAESKAATFAVIDRQAGFLKLSRRSSEAAAPPTPTVGIETQPH